MLRRGMAETCLGYACASLSVATVKALACVYKAQGGTGNSLIIYPFLVYWFLWATLITEIYILIITGGQKSAVKVSAEPDHLRRHRGRILQWVFLPSGGGVNPCNSLVCSGATSVCAPWSCGCLPCGCVSVLMWINLPLLSLITTPISGLGILLQFNLILLGYIHQVHIFKWGHIHWYKVRTWTYCFG